MARHAGGHRFSRRRFLRGSATVASVSWAAPRIGLGATSVGKPMTRKLGRTGFDVTTLGLGGQGSLQWTPPGVNPEQIILKAFSFKKFRDVNTFVVFVLDVGLFTVPGNMLFYP